MDCVNAIPTLSLDLSHNLK